MATVNTKLIKRRLKSVTNTAKITKAMELVSAAKMRKTVAAATNSRAFSAIAGEMLTTLLPLSAINSHPLVAPRAGRQILTVLLTSNRGLCGGLNANLFKALVQWQKDQTTTGQEISAIIVGKKGEAMARKLGWNVIAAFSETSDTPRWSELAPIVEMINQEYAQKPFAAVYIMSTDFISALSQKPFISQLLPLVVKTMTAPKSVQAKPEQATKQVDAAAQEAVTAPGHATASSLPVEYKFEPTPQDVLNILLPQILETQVYQASLEAAAAEHSARMVAMRNAGEAAGEMIDDLVFTFNQARQASITQEIAEVAGGAAAMQ